MPEPTLKIPDIARPPRVLVVEDQPEMLRLVSSMVAVRQFPVRQAVTLAQARRLIEREPPDIMFLDVTLPDGSGLSLVERGGADDPLVVVITGAFDMETAVLALRKGAVDYITKPFTVGDLFARIDQVAAEWRARERLRAHACTLEGFVRRATDDLANTERRLEEAYDAAVVALAAALEMKDFETEDHCRRVSLNAVRLGREAGMPEEQLGALRRGSYLHDVGKIGVPERILAQIGGGTGEDRRIMEQHPAMGCRILGAAGFLAGATDLVRCHHERFDGLGYPARLAAEAIPVSARIFAIVDALDEATSDRPEHRARPFPAFAEELAQDGGHRFDPRLAVMFLRMDPAGWLMQKAGDQAPVPG